MSQQSRAGEVGLSLHVHQLHIPARAYFNDMSSQQGIITLFYLPSTHA